MCAGCLPQPAAHALCVCSVSGGPRALAFACSTRARTQTPTAALARADDTYQDGLEGVRGHVDEDRSGCPAHESERLVQVVGGDGVGHGGRPCRRGILLRHRHLQLRVREDVVHQVK